MYCVLFCLNHKCDSFDSLGCCYFFDKQFFLPDGEMWIDQQISHSKSLVFYIPSVFDKPYSPTSFFFIMPTSVLPVLHSFYHFFFLRFQPIPTLFLTVYMCFDSFYIILDCCYCIQLFLLYQCTK